MGIYDFAFCCYSASVFFGFFRPCVADGVIIGLLVNALTNLSPRRIIDKDAGNGSF